MKCCECKYGMKIPLGDWHCRRFPPHAIVIPQSNGATGIASQFPAVHPDAWCGEYAYNEELDKNLNAPAPKLELVPKEEP